MWNTLRGLADAPLPPGELGLAAGRVAVVLACTLVAAALLRRSSASRRHLVLWLGTFAALAVPVVSLWVPRLNVPVLEPRVDAPALADAAFGAFDQAPASADAAFGAFDHAPLPAIAEALPPLAAAPAGSAASPSGPAPTPRGWSPTGPQVVLGVWGAGVLVVLMPFALGLIRRRRLASTAEPWLPDAWEGVRRRLAASGAVPARMLVLATRRSDMPMTWGVWRPVILVPYYSTWSDEERVAALLHEMAHVTRRDALTQLLLTTVRALHWYNPLAWMVASMERMAREAACDDLVLAAGVRPSTYAEQLLGVAHGAPMGLPVAALTMARRSSVAQRLTAILSTQQRRDAAGWQGAMVAATAAALLSTTIAAASPVPRERTGVPRAASRGTGTATTRSTSPFVAPSMRPPPVTRATTSSPAVEPAAADESPAIPAPAYASPIPSAVRPGGSAVAPVTLTLPQRDCFTRTRFGNNSVSSQTNNDRRRITLKRNGCVIEIDARGRFTLSAALDDIASIARGGYFELTEDDGSTEREVRIEPDDAGGLSHQYKVNGRSRPWDAEARAWFGRITVALDRRTAWAVDVRLPALLQRGGVEAVLGEMDLMDGDYARRVYFTRLTATATLSSAQLTRVIDAARDKIESDYEMAELLIAAAKQPAFDESAQRALAGAAARIASSYEKRRAYSSLLKRDDLSTATVGSMLAGARSMDSDYELAELLIDVSRRFAIQPATREFYYDALASINSDYEFRRVLAAVLASGPPTREQATRVIEQAGAHMRGYELAEALIAVTRATRELDMAGTAMLHALRNVGSDYERTRVMKEILRNKPDTGVVLGILGASRDVRSSYERAELLLAVAKTFTIEGRLREAYLVAARDIDSEYDRGRALAGAIKR